MFDRAVAACAAVQSVTARSAEAVARARAVRVSSRRLRTLIAETCDAWAIADRVYADMRGEVERVARELRESGVDHPTAAATVRTHIRFVLYDGGLTERDTEPVVSRASSWLNEVYEAA